MRLLKSSNLNGRVVVFLVGGLGNQIFQYAAGLSRSPKIMLLDSKLGSPRENKSGLPALFDFQLIQNSSTYLGWSRKNTFVRKICEKYAWFFIGFAMKPTKHFPAIFLRVTTNFIAKIIFSIWLLSPTRITVAPDNGFFPMSKKFGQEYLIGYFQTYVWASDPIVFKELMKLELKSPSEEYIQFLELISDQHSIALHVRLGDYKGLKGFGILSRGYYSEALSLLSESIKIERILLFSDEPGEAINYIPVEFLNRTLIVPSFNGNAAETLQVMRLCSNYIIGNSSLSWWGAFLSYSTNPIVVAPEPWFATKPEPNLLIPPNWIRLPSCPDDK